MAEYTELPQTLRDALIAEGNQEQANLLNEEGAALTRDQIIAIVNNVSWGGLSDATLTILRKISVMRVKSHQPLFPWNDKEFLDDMREDLPPAVY